MATKSQPKFSIKQQMFITLDLNYFRRGYIAALTIFFSFFDAFLPRFALTCILLLGYSSNTGIRSQQTENFFSYNT